MQDILQDPGSVSADRSHSQSPKESADRSHNQSPKELGQVQGRQAGPCTGQCTFRTGVESGMSQEFDLGQARIGAGPGRHNSIQRYGQDRRGLGPVAVQSRSSRAGQGQVRARPELFLLLLD